MFIYISIHWLISFLTLQQMKSIISVFTIILAERNSHNQSIRELKARGWVGARPINESRSALWVINLGSFRGRAVALHARVPAVEGETLVAQELILTQKYLLVGWAVRSWRSGKSISCLARLYLYSSSGTALLSPAVKSSQLYVVTTRVEVSEQKGCFCNGRRVDQLDRGISLFNIALQRKESREVWNKTRTRKN